MAKQLHRLAVTTGTALVIALSAGVAISAEQLQPASPQKHHAATSEGTQARAKPDHLPEEKKQSFEAFPDYASPDCYRAATYEASSLCPAWRSAIAAEHSAKAAERANEIALWALIFSAAGVMGLLATLYQTNKSLAESRRSANAAEEAIAQTREVGEAQVRCYLSISAAAVAFYPPDLKPRLGLTISNVGQSPAFDITLAIEIQYSVLGQPDRRSDRLATSMAALTLAPGASIELVQEVFDFPLALAEQAHLAGPGDLLGVTVKVIMSGQDVFGKQVTTQALYGGNVSDINIVTPMRFLGNGLPAT